MEAGIKTLAESLLDDLDDLSDNEVRTRNNESDLASDSDQQLETDIIDPTVGESLETSERDSTVHHLAKNGNGNAKIFTSSGSSRFIDDKTLQDHLTKVRFFQQPSSIVKGVSTVGIRNGIILSEEKDYELITSTNKFLFLLMDELQRAHAEITVAYKPKFPELEELLIDPLLYRQAVGVIQNEMDMTLLNDELNILAGLSPNQIITLSVAGSSSSGRLLTPSELHNVQAACEYFDKVRSIQLELIGFIEQRMEQLAPNTCVIIGPTLAARLIALAGGLAELSRIPSCNLQVLGQSKHTSTSRAGLGLSLSMGTVSGVSKVHQGILGECDLVTNCSIHLQRKALKLVANKLALAIRADLVNAQSGRQRNRDTGVVLRREIEDKFLQWDEPNKAPTVKALPKPDMTTKKRRGGKRIRRLKERFEETDLMKQANRRGFNSEVGEYGDDAMGRTLGMLDSKQATGSTRSLLATAEKKKHRHANTKASRKRALQATWSGRSSAPTSGLASSMSFTPVQGLELINPDANKDRVREANRKWFGENAGFLSALPK